MPSRRAKTSDRPASRAPHERRLAMLTAPHMAPLTAFVDQIRAERGDGDDARAVPYFDPLDGGVQAEALLLSPAPGRQALETGFVSADGDGEMAGYVGALLREAGLSRKSCLLWNIVPWHSRGDLPARTVMHDLSEGLAHLQTLIGMLPRLRVVVLLGRRARRAYSLLPETVPLATFETLCPSPRVLATEEDARVRILAVLRQVRTYLDYVPRAWSGAGSGACSTPAAVLDALDRLPISDSLY